MIEKLVIFLMAASQVSTVTETSESSSSTSKSTSSSSSSFSKTHPGGSTHFSQSSKTSEDDTSWYLHVKVQGYKQDELNINLIGRSLTVEGKHEEGDETLNQFQQNFMVPSTVIMDSIESKWDPKECELLISGSKVENKKQEQARKIDIKLKQDL